MSVPVPLQSRIRWLICVCLALLAAAPPAHAQGQQKGDASLRVEYQYQRTGAFEADTFVADYWTTDSHAVLLSADYAVNERLTVYATLPYVRKRFNPGPADIFGTGAGDPHDPNAEYWVDFVPPDKRFHDDGEYHGDFQDLGVGMMYRAVDGPSWSISPYLGYSLPITNYPFFAKAAIGARLWNVPVGVDIGFVPLFSDWHFRANLAYVFSEKPLDVKVDYWLAHLSAGYWFKPNLSVDIFLSSKYLVNGLKLDYGDFLNEEFLDEPKYPRDFDNIRWWMHDRLLQHRILNAGLSVDHFINRKYQLSARYFRTVWSEQTTEIDNGFSFSLTRYFSAGEFTD